MVRRGERDKGRGGSDPAEGRGRGVRVSRERGEGGGERAYTGTSCGSNGHSPAGSGGHQRRRGEARRRHLRGHLRGGKRDIEEEN